MIAPRDPRLAEAVEIAAEGLTGRELEEHLAGRFPELAHNGARLAWLAEYAEARVDPAPLIPFPHGRPANGTPAGKTWLALLELARRAGLDVIDGLQVGVAFTRCPLCGWTLRITDTDPNAHLYCGGGCDDQDVLAAIGKAVRR